MTHIDLQNLLRVLADPFTDWEHIATRAATEGIAPLLYHLLRENPYNIPPNAMHRLQSAYYATAYRNTMLMEEAQHISKLFQRNGVRGILLKGMALLKDVYPNIALRPMADIDIMVEDQYLDAVKEILVEEGYERPEQPCVEAWAFNKKGAVIEVHGAFLKYPLADKILRRDLWRRAAPHPAFPEEIAEERRQHTTSRQEASEPPRRAAKYESGSSIRNSQSEILSLKSEIRNPKSEILPRKPHSESRIPEAGLLRSSYEHQIIAIAAHHYFHEQLRLVWHIDILQILCSVNKSVDWRKVERYASGCGLREVVREMVSRALELRLTPSILELVPREYKTYKARSRGAHSDMETSDLGRYKRAILKTKGLSVRLQVILNVFWPSSRRLRARYSFANSNEDQPIDFTNRRQRICGKRSTRDSPTSKSDILLRLWRISHLSLTTARAIVRFFILNPKPGSRKEI